MNILKYDFSSDIQVVNLGDVHRGDETCDVKAFLRDIEYIRSHENCYWVSTGDLLNVALKSSKSNVYTSMSLTKELGIIRKELEPIAKKCLGLVASNHHARLEKDTGLDLDSVICDALGLPFLGKIGLINLKVGASCYYVGMHHGLGGGSMRGGKINGLSRLARIIPGADIYLEGHTHSYASFINEVPYIDKKRNTFKSHKAHFVTTGHYLQWDDSYAQDLKLEPMPIGSAILDIKAGSSGLNEYKRVRADLLC